MATMNQLAEHHVREHEARLKHIDELFEEADKNRQEEESPKISEELEALKQERGMLVDQLDQLRNKSIEEWAAKGGPMVMWDIVANRLEKLVERIKH